MKLSRDQIDTVRFSPHLSAAVTGYLDSYYGTPELASKSGSELSDDNYPSCTTPTSMR